ncbi:glycosyltransferase family 4 protein [Candidatus Gracilibacteria bacterium]|nr:glycosyltransferase family 4 protein [Candidatus Gracilibacteria bacterium]NJM87059.1 glycosyltransferase family 4 protein [Hydrococcus sp. RU_2_2]NJP18375.1 glycosyltransferase family 4 protein [Hydrococcus sp. CRU_1_1]
MAIAIFKIIMHILIVSCVFSPEPVTSAVTSEQLAIGLVKKGHRVTVITAFPNRPGGKLYPGYTRSWRKVEQTEAGYELIRTYSWLSTQPTVLSRLLENLSFGVASTLNALSIKPDLVYANTWPLFASGFLTALCSLRKLPLVINIQDIYPDAAIELGKFPSSGLLPQLLRSLDTWIAHQSITLVTLSENFARFYSKTRQVPPQKVHIVYNWLDDEEIKPGSRIGNFRNQQNISEDTFLVMYAGNIGVNAGVEFVIEAATKLQDLPDVLFIIAGDGSCRKACEDLAQKYELANLRFFYPLPKEEFSEVQAAADLMILPTRKSGSLTSVPSKLIAYMLSGRTVLATVDEESDTARIIKEARCGVCVAPEDPDAIAKAIRMSIQIPDELNQMGQQARSYALQNFSSQVCLPKLISILESAIQK